jgi:hypothetical protein
MKAFMSAYTTIHTHISLLFTHPADIRVCWMIISGSKTFLRIVILVAVCCVYVLGGVLEKLNQR